MLTRLLYLLPLLFLPFLAMAQKIIVIDIDGTINPASSGYIQRGIEKAEKDNAACLVIIMNTPGGLLKSTRVIVGDMMKSTVPIVVYVSPSGAHAGSAGVFITLAANVAAMAPGTNIGAAHPVSMQSGGDSTMNEKSTNDAVAFVRTIAEKRGRNAQWAENAVRKSYSITETEALDLKVIDLIATNMQDLLKQINGRTIEVTGGAKTINTSKATIENVEMSFIEKLLDIIGDPNVAYILMMIGFYGLLFELYSPGAIFPGIAGVIALILAFYSLHTLPINYAGLALIVFGIILFLLEIKIISHGLLAIGGTISLLLGSMMLIRKIPNMEFLRISWGVIIPTVVVTVLFFLFVIGAGLRAQRAKPITGVEGLKDETGLALETLNPTGTVLVHGEIWNADAIEGIIEKGKRVRVISIDNLRLKVELDK